MMVTGPDYTGFHHANDTALVVGLQKGVPGAPGFDGFYRFLTGHMSGQGHGVCGIEDEDWEATVSYIDHNEYLGFQSSLNTPGGFSSEGHTSTGYCSGCHGNFHVVSRYADGIVECPPGSEEQICFEWKGHPVGMVLPSDGDLDFYRYTTYNPNVPLGRPDLSTFTGPSPEVRPGVDAINCLSCHRSHGTPGGSHLRWDPTDWDGCAQCHKTKKKWSQDYYLCDEIDDCNDCHTSHGKSLRFPEDEFGPTENDMLIWMRVEVKSSPVQITVPANTNDTYVQVAQGDIDVFEVGAIIEIRDATNSQQLRITSIDAVAYQYHFVGDPLQNSYAVGSNLYHVDLRDCTFPIPGDSPYVRADTPPGAGYDGICEVCHTETLYWRNDGTGAPHYGGPGASEQCLDCHEHTSEFLGEMPEDAAHNTHTQGLPRGPDPMQCEECHEDGDTVAEMADAGACDACHSPGGAFDGVNNPDIGVKYNWPDAQASLDSLIYEADGTALKSGKQDWCAGCHDDGSSMIGGVTAPNVMGDNLSYGFNISGHGRPSAGKNCGDCHDFTRLHVDSQARTYVAASHNYRNGYRLNEDMAVPRNGEIDPQAFKLCTDCHDYSAITGPTSNFRDDQKSQQYHEMHLNTQPAWPASDSDFDGTGCSTGSCIDSAMTCVNCHNVHGSPTAAMIRHGELISSPGTNDKVPAFSFSWYKADGSTPTMTVQESRYGAMECGIWPDVSVNHVCGGCHVQSLLYYQRTPIQSLCECELVPDATVIQRSGTLGFQASVTNNTGGMGTVLFGTKITKPDASQTGFIWGPIQVYLNPHQTKSGHKNHTIPVGFELGMYTYHGYVGRYGNIYDECQFDFEVVP
jgi:predicted CXXCH cytochrome family protein